MKIPQKFKWGCIAFLVTVITVFAYMLYKPVTAPTVVLDGWAAEIKQHGGKEAYVRMKSQIANMDIGSQHVKAHEFGGALYEVEGINGLNACDSSIGYGCYHQFFLSAISDKGIDIAYELDKKCIEFFGIQGQGCQHGLGHGALEYFGGSITDALEVCEKMVWQGKLFGCQTGVFMENNFPVFINEDGSKKQNRIVDKEKPYEPCHSIKPKFLEACILAQTELWVKTQTFSYNEIEVLCSKLLGQDVRATCLKGTGASIAAYKNFDIEQLTDSCAVMSLDNNKLFCQAGGYWAFWDNEPNYRSMSKKVCEVFNDQVDRCIKEGSLLEYVKEI